MQIMNRLFHWLVSVVSGWFKWALPFIVQCLLPRQEGILDHYDPVFHGYDHFAFEKSSQVERFPR